MSKSHTRCMISRIAPPKPARVGFLISFAAAALLGCGTANGGENSAKAMELFEKRVRPTLIHQCIRCHGPEKQKAGLRLDTKEGWSQGGDTGPSIVAGKPNDSLILKAIRYESHDLEMPPRGKLDDQTIRAFENWIKLGAPDPRLTLSGTTESAAVLSSTPTIEQVPPSIEQGRTFWSFQQIAEPELPDTIDRDWPADPMDRFVLAKLESAGLRPVPDANKRTLARRLFYDLVGLPPTPEQINEFLSDSSPMAYANLVDRLLASQHFGERWGRHWLDVVRFAESSGGGRTLLLPNAWRYRDYVIESFNDDVPYDQFVMEQIAGDLMPFADVHQRRRRLVATGFLLLGPTNYEMQDKEILEMDVVDEQLDTMGKALLGMTIGCARCHDHKFDPLPTSDYYAMAGIFKSTRSLVHSNVSKWNTTALPLPPAEESKRRLLQEKLAAAKRDLAKAKKRWIRAGGKPDPKDEKAIDLDSLVGIAVDDTSAKREGKWTDSTSLPFYVGEHYIHDANEAKGEKQVTFRPPIEQAGKYEVRVSYASGSNRSRRVPVHVFHSAGEHIARIDQKKTPGIDGVFESIGVFDFDPALQPRIVISNEGTEDGVVIADAVMLLATDSERAPASEATSRFGTSPETDANSADLKALKKERDRLAGIVATIEKSVSQLPRAMSTVDADETGDIHLAIRGMPHQKGPLTRRGAMQVASWESFPEIPDRQSGRKELADWIADHRNPLTARVMVNRVWSWLFGRGIVSSVDNFGSMGEPPTHPELLDHLACGFVEENWSIKSLIRKIVLSRTYRLASEVNDAGSRVDPENRLIWRMNRKRLRAEDIRDTLLLVGGSLDFEHGGSNIKAGTKSEYGYQFESTRRSVYVPVFRNRLPEILEVFDVADPNIQGGMRNSSTVASQALLMMNHPQVLRQTQMAAERRSITSDDPTGNRIEKAYLQILGRPPSKHEMLVAVDFVNNRGDDGNEASRWAMLYQILFQCIDFRYLD